METRKNEREPADLGPDDGSVGFAPDREGFGGTEPPRPDAAIHRDIVERMSRHPRLDSGGCKIVVRKGEVQLAGVVASAHARRLIEDLCLSVTGVWECDNALRVSRRSMTAGRVDPDRG
jgi:osmotically-inducible protein OsmY